MCAQGLRPGDRVALQLPNLPQFVIAYFGILKAGCDVVPMNGLLKVSEISYQLADSEARELITWSGSGTAPIAAELSANLRFAERQWWRPGLPAPAATTRGATMNLMEG